MPQTAEPEPPAALFEDVDPAAAAAVQRPEPGKVPGGQGADQRAGPGTMDVPQRHGLGLQKGDQALGIYSFNLQYNIPVTKLPLFLIPHSPTE